jgi:pyruvate/2-oxoglutarate dehydrogenase complex dihydrolipoamide acyltransferase (E2) component
MQATIEITSRYSGTIRRVHHAKGDVVKVSDVPCSQSTLDAFQ